MKFARGKEFRIQLVNLQQYSHPTKVAASPRLLLDPVEPLRAERVSLARFVTSQSPVPETQLRRGAGSSFTRLIVLLGAIRSDRYQSKLRLIERGSIFPLYRLSPTRHHSSAHVEYVALRKLKGGAVLLNKGDPTVIQYVAGIKPPLFPHRLRWANPPSHPRILPATPALPSSAMVFTPSTQPASSGANLVRSTHYA
ncbi:hypothetical protein K443DRAFT_14387 [Laccaria amethystina LaAM-08-1]|uniref:Uncharacterized protein n=1 Tax=Laccaria amethystina LaAM-08-1 TaxID=1095629 RepID=A0A0C9X1H9_9AGAR|nr:hypothetical protein K443DRAFT_14387 [Laccaria amethystina LaAM-08-1]